MNGPELMPVPHAIDAERSVIGAAMVSRDAWLKVSDWLLPEHFYRSAHQSIWRAICELAAQDKPSDSVTVCEWLEAHALEGSDEAMEASGGNWYAGNIAAYAEIVLERFRQRELVNIGTKLTSDGYRPSGRTAAEAAMEAQKALSALQGASQAGGLRPSNSFLREWFDDLKRRYENESLPGLPTPWKDINDATGGLQDGEVIVLAGRSNMGKSQAGCQLGGFTALRGDHTAIFSIEMGGVQVIRRQVACFGQVDANWLKQPKGDDENWSRVTEIAARLKSAPMMIDEQPRMTVGQIVARAKREHMRKPIRLVVIDHLHEILLPKKGRDDIELGDAAREIKGLAKYLQCPILLLAQLNRGAATDHGRRPTMADLRGSGGIEEVADVILLLHREDYYRPGEMRGVVEVIIGKGRDIEAGKTIHLRNRFDQSRLEDGDGLEIEPPQYAQKPQRTQAFGKMKRATP